MSMQEYREKMISNSRQTQALNEAKQEVMTAVANLKNEIKVIEAKLEAIEADSKP